MVPSLDLPRLPVGQPAGQPAGGRRRHRPEAWPRGVRSPQGNQGWSVMGHVTLEPPGLFKFEGMSVQQLHKMLFYC